MTGEHQAQLAHFPADSEPEAFVVMCSCATVSLPFPTRAEATQWAVDHGATLSEDVQTLTGEGGVGWACMFCGSAIDEAPLRLSVSWTDSGVDDEQWFAAHRRCLLERMSTHEMFSPRFAQ